MRCPWGSVEDLSVCPSLSGSIRAVVWLSEAICLSAFLSRAVFPNHRPNTFMGFLLIRSQPTPGMDPLDVFQPGPSLLRLFSLHTS